MDKYLQYDHIELADDPSFIKWAKGQKSQEGLDWDAWLSDHPNKEEDVKNAVQLVRNMQFVHDEAPQSVEDNIWSKINNDIQSKDKKSISETSNKGRVFRMLSYGAAAAVALILLLVNMGSDYDTTVSTSYAMVESVTLPDGSEVQINSDSKLEYDAESWNEERTLHLEGEAFFSVEKGSKFTVTTDYGDVSVLGTSFNVNTRNNKLDVICKTGKVAVTTLNKETILTPSQAVKVDAGKHNFVEQVASNVDRSKWTKGIYTYNGEVLSNVLADLERQYDVKIKIDEGLSDNKYSGGFAKGNLDSSLSEVLWPLGYTFQIKENIVEITKK